MGASSQQRARWQPDLPPILLNFEPPGEFWRTVVEIRRATVAHTHGPEWLRAQIRDLDGPTIFEELVDELGPEAPACYTTRK